MEPSSLWIVVGLVGFVTAEPGREHLQGVFLLVVVVFWFFFFARSMWPGQGCNLNHSSGDAAS